MTEEIFNYEDWKDINVIDLIENLKIAILNINRLQKEKDILFRKISVLSTKNAILERKLNESPSENRFYGIINKAGLLKKERKNDR